MLIGDLEIKKAYQAFEGHSDIPVGLFEDFDASGGMKAEWRKFLHRERSDAVGKCRRDARDVLWRAALVFDAADQQVSIADPKPSIQALKQ